MSVPVVKFNHQDRPEFFKVLRTRVNQHFKQNERSKHANANMVLKTIFMLTVYTTPLVVILTGTVTSFWPFMGLWILMGLGMSGIGLSIMHDANHGSYSNNKTVNKALGYLLNYVGGYHVNWKIQHNVLHHSFTNVEGFDEDIDKGVMRFSPTQEHKKGFVAQAFYAPILYGLLTIYWLIFKDFQQLYRYHRKGLLKRQGLSFGKALMEILMNKAWYVSLTLVLPLLIVPVPTGWIIGGFLAMQFLSGLILAFIFQPAHVLEETEFFEPDDQGSVENNWAIHQLRTTANFANGSRIFSWLIGGLNFQIEHHLFPHICHVHYRDIAPIVKATAEEFGLPYYHHKTFFGALRSHFSLLHALGTGSYDRRVETKVAA